MSSTSLPPEIDRMLWSVAESNDPRAIEEMGERYPAFRAELASRIQLVRTLKGARPTREAPRLQLPKQQPAPSWFRRPLAMATAGALLATLALATVVTVSANRVQKLPTVIPVDVEVKSPEEVKQPSVTVAPDSNKDPELPNVPKVGVEPDVNPAKGTLVEFETKGMALKALVKQLALLSGHTVEFAPGFPEETVAANYRGVTFEEALADLGQNFGFTALAEGEKKLLIVPATDPSRPEVSLPNGSHSEAVDGISSASEAETKLNIPKK